MWLAIDTATERASVALGESGVSALEENLSGARRHVAQLLPMVDTLLRRAGATLENLHGLALSDGPGSFTGLRVGAAVAKALVRTRGLPLWTAPSLLVRAAGVAAVNGSGDPGAEPTVLAVADALRGELYAAAYRFRPGEIMTVLSPSVWRPEALMRSMAGPDIVVGEVPSDSRTMLEAWSRRRVVAPPEGAPHAARLIDLVGRPGGAERVEDVAAWEPVYGRPAEAQVRWEIAHGRPLPNSASGLS